jgi:glutamate dehydrogenase
MAIGTEEVQAERIEGVVALVREKLAGEVAARVEEFVRQYYAAIAPEDLLARSVLDTYGAALAHWHLAQQRTAGKAKVRVYTPELEEHGWQSTHTVAEIVTDDMPFLVDSVGMELNRHGLGIHLVVHPVVAVRRDEQGHLREILQLDDESDDVLRESLVHMEVDRQTEPEVLERLHDDLDRVLADVRAAVEDWPRMRERLQEIVNDLDADPPPVGSEDIAEAKALLQWVHDDNFTFLGYREYELLSEGGDDVLRAVSGTGLGILRDADGKPASRSFAKLPPEARALARAPTLLTLTKANSRSTVHRPAYLDYVGIKHFGASGEVERELRFLGLYTSIAYRARPGEIPILRRKVERVLERSGFRRGSHDYKNLVDVLETYPRDELFQITEEELFDIAMGILHLGDRKRVRLFVRRDAYGRFVSCLVYVPRERYTTETRLRMQEILQEAFDGVSADFSVRFTEGPLARVHFVVRTEPGAFPGYNVGDIERRLVDVTRSWSDDLQEALVDEFGEERGNALFRKYRSAFPPAYRADVPARMAVPDVDRAEGLDPAGDLAMSLYRPLEAPEGFLRFKLVRSGQALLLSDVLPLLENMGVQVVDEHPYEIKPAQGPPVWIYDFGLAAGGAGDLETDRLREIFQDAFAQTWRGEAESDGFNRLVLRAQLTAREISVLRAFCKYLRQTKSPYSQGYMEQTLSGYPHIARLLVALFRTRFDPSGGGGNGASESAVTEEIERALDEVPTLDEDRILRSLLELTQAILRTNYFQKEEDGRSKPYLSFKLDPSRVPDLPLPRPVYEIFVCSPRTEGVHLRAGKVARGGIRWSDRREDFRTEVLGLMKAQTVKNAVIVPVGAKGGFVVKRPPADGDRDALQQEVIACYSTLIAGMLDLTDNIVGAEIVPPEDVVRYDEDDPYLVVAADKGTATFSDIANSISQDYGFWLGDAFASGGSSGYDHKKMAITARGAWESVKRHFRELGVDIQSTDFTVVGIGDMSGDVFGNGMLLSEHIKLLAAFDHRHVFLDPDPDPEASFRERRRLFDLPRSSWADYDPKAISQGGGVFPRTAKSIPLSPEVRKALRLEADALPPNELISALLSAPVDLLWNGGIGTYIKASHESHSDVGDKTNDALRVDATKLRCRVVGEGGNLGFTQLGRIEYALGGGRINTDFIDNSAGVDCSDHEVNIKILLDSVVANGDLTEKQRNRLIAEMTDAVADHVLRDNYGQTQALSLAERQALPMLDVHARLIRGLEQAGKLNRALEFLPDDEAVSERKNAGHGLTAPELAVLLAYSKITLYEALVASDVPEDPYLSRDLERYFPTPLSERFRAEMERHRLRRELIATFVTNSLVNRAGITFVFRLAEETGATPPEIARAYTIARDAFDLRSLWAEVEALDNAIAADTQLTVLLEGRKLVERATRWLLGNRRQALDISGTVSYFAPGVAALAGAMPQLLVFSEREALERAAAGLEAAGVPAELAARAAGLGPLFSSLDIVDVAGVTGLEVEQVGAAYFALGARLNLHWLRDQIATLPREDRWQTLARAALREDLYAQHRQLTIDVLQGGPEDAGVEERIAAWTARSRAQIERCEQALTDIRMGGLYDLTTLSVALREIRNLTQVGAPFPTDELLAPQVGAPLAPAVTRVGGGRGSSRPSETA